MQIGITQCAMWNSKLDEFLRFNERNVLPDAGKVSREMADEKAAREYEAFSARRRAEIEALEEADAMKQLEEAAKKLPDRKKSRPEKKP